jgi:hypothetical protein
MKQLDPNTMSFIYATAFMTSICFAIGAFIPSALVLRWLFF